jgi:DNA-binding NtrC family response regulator
MDVRFVAATNVDLQARVAAGEFRADLYFRLAQYTIRLPALRERTADIAYLAKRFLIEASVELRKPIADLAPPAIAMLRECAWSGNVRELRNVVRQAVLRTSGTMVDESTLRTILGTSARTSAPSVDLHIEGRSLREIADAAAHEAERAAIREALRAAGGNKTQAARALKTDFKTLHVKMKQLGISTGAD